MITHINGNARIATGKDGISIMYVLMRPFTRDASVNNVRIVIERRELMIPTAINATGSPHGERRVI
jgi:hypothetical protein